MNFPTPRLLSLPIILTLATLFLGAGCSSCENVVKKADPPWIKKGEIAPYELLFPGTWQLERPESINPHAEIAASREDKYFLLVIPQELPEFPRPDVFALQKTALQMLQDSVDNFLIERQGPLELDQTPGLSVFARGELQGRAIRYITSYIVHGDFGYQIIAFAELEDEQTLLEDMDLILSHWRFTDTEQAETPDEEPELAAEPAAPIDEN